MARAAMLRIIYGLVDALLGLPVLAFALVSESPS